MQTETHSINDVLAKNATSFFIPPFQRAYAWGKSEIERYFNDIMRIIYSEHDTNQKDKLEHFFGTLVIKEEKAGFVNRSIIVDGQQRLTTTLLFLIALRDLTNSQEQKDFITNNYLTNNSSSFQDKIKLKQVTKDWNAYRSLINNEEAQVGFIKTAYETFKKLIENTKATKPNVSLEDYIMAIQRMNVAVIFLDERPYKGEDPQIIFETLNSLGKPLTLSDLIRNYVLLNMDSDKQTDVYETIWYPKIEKQLNDNASDFFRDFLQYKLSTSVKAVSDNNTKEIYAAFKDFVEKNYADHKAFIDDIVCYVDLYKWIVSEEISDKISSNISNDRKIKELLRNIFHDIKTEAFKPFVMGLLFHHQNQTSIFNDDDLILTLKTIRTYLIRRRLVKLTQGENKSIVLLCNRIIDIAQAKISIISLLSTLFYKMRLPNDDEIRQALVAANFYEDFKNYRKFILGKIEENNTKVSVDFRDPKITIEHIMPQRLQSEWEKDLGENWNEIHNKFLHNIGNLILTEFNSEIGNNSFSDKKEFLKKSSLFYRIEIINYNKWGIEEIKKHQETMINWFLDTFPLPEEYKYSQNWNTKKQDITIFSPLDNDAGDIAEGNKPVNLKIGETELKVSSWQDVFIKILSFIKDEPSYDFQFILDNQGELFNNDNTIISWSSLKKMIEENRDLSTRYKTLTGATWDKAEKLDENTLFVHINISALSCMNRIANVMNKFSISADYISITLK